MRVRSSGGTVHEEGVGRGGVEPPTFRFSGGRSYRLSYLPATPTGLEPATSAVTGRRANQLRYGARHGRADRWTTVPEARQAVPSRERRHIPAGGQAARSSQGGVRPPEFR